MAEKSKQKKTKSERWYRTKDVLEIVPISKSTWWEGVKTGRFPKPTYLGKRMPCWSDSQIQELMRKGA